MICKRGNDPCPMIGCDCYHKASHEEVDAELRAHGFTGEKIDAISAQSKTVVRLCKELAQKDAAIAELVEALEKAAIGQETLVYIYSYGDDRSLQDLVSMREDATLALIAKYKEPK